MASGQLLDMSKAVFGGNKDSYAIAEILAALGLPVTMKSFDVIARDLSRLVAKSPSWTKKYVHSVYKGHITPSPEFSRAIEKLAQIVDGTPEGVAGSAFVRVLADPQKIPDGVLVPANAVVVKCARPGCPVWFIRVNPRQIFHDPECRKKDRTERKAAMPK